MGAIITIHFCWADKGTKLFVEKDTEGAILDAETLLGLAKLSLVSCAFQFCKNVAFLEDFLGRLSVEPRCVVARDVDQVT